MKRLSLYVFLVLMFSVFTSYSFAENKIKYKTYKKFPCNFNGAKIDSPAAIAFKNSSRCSKAKGYPLKRGTSILIKRGTPVFAVTDMKLLYAKDRSAKQRSRMYNKTQKKQGIDYIFDDVELMFIDKNQNQLLFYHLMDTPFVPGFGKGKCERPLEFGTEKYKRNPNYCGGYSDKIIKNKMWVKKGDLIGHSGTTGSNSKGDPHISFSFIINNENLSEKEKKLCDLQIKKNFKQKECKKWSPLHCYQCYYAPEARKDIIWENFPSDNSDYYLLPIINKKYLKEIGYYN